MNGRDWLRRRVRVYAGFDGAKRYPPMAVGEVIGYIDGPSILVRDATGHIEAWPVSLPIEADTAPDAATSRDRETDRKAEG